MTPTSARKWRSPAGCIAGVTTALELRKRDGEWVRAPWVDGTFVVNLGDMFKVWTNDVYVSMNMVRKNGL